MTMWGTLGDRRNRLFLISGESPIPVNVNSLLGGMVTLHCRRSLIPNRLLSEGALPTVKSWSHKGPISPARRVHGDLRGLLRPAQGCGRRVGPVSRHLWHREDISSSGHRRCQSPARNAGRTRGHLRSGRVAKIGAQRSAGLHDLCVMFDIGGCMGATKSILRTQTCQTSLRYSSRNVFAGSIPAMRRVGTAVAIVATRTSTKTTVTMVGAS
jgi:hypothetical protein